MRYFLIFYAYEELNPSGSVRMGHLVMEASTFPEKSFVLEKIQKKIGRVTGRFKILGITGITEVNEAEVGSYIS